MHRPLFGLTAVVLGCILWGCGASQPLTAYPPAQRSYSTSYTSHRHRPAERAHSTRSRYASGESSAAPAALSPPADRTTATAPSSPAVSLSMAGDSGDRERAQQLLQTADANLVRARKRHLTAAEQETYQRASQLAGRARRALADNDSAAASSLAAKASSLASGLSGE